MTCPGVLPLWLCFLVSIIWSLTREFTPALGHYDFSSNPTTPAIKRKCLGEGHEQWLEAVRAPCLPRGLGDTAVLSERPQGCVPHRHMAGSPAGCLACSSASCPGDGALVSPACLWLGQGGAWDLPVMDGWWWAENREANEYCPVNQLGDWCPS